MNIDRTMGITTNVGRANPQRIELRGHDLVNDLMGQASYTETLLLGITGRRPSPAEIHVVDAVLVSLVDHGLQPSALAARLTYAAAPDAVQGALAAGLLGAGSELLGSMEQAGKLLSAIGEAVRGGAAAATAAEREVSRLLAADLRVPGFGHQLHRDGDPRASRLLQVARETGIAGDEVGWLALIGAELKRTDRPVAPNATGVAAAILLGVGIPWRLHRGVAIVSRAAGLLAHIAEEIKQPITPLVRDALRRASWLAEEDPKGGSDGGDPR